MSRILYVECRAGEPYADAQGVVIATVGPICEAPLPPKPWEWLPYVPASELESKDGLIECLKADRDSFVAERNQLRTRLTQERTDHLQAEDQALAKADELRADLHELQRAQARDCGSDGSQGRAAELAIICSNTPGWELTPYREAVRVIQDIESECDDWAKRGRETGKYVGRINREKKKPWPEQRRPRPGCGSWRKRSLRI